MSQPSNARKALLLTPLHKEPIIVIVNLDGWSLVSKLVESKSLFAPREPTLEQLKEPITQPSKDFLFPLPEKPTPKQPLGVYHTNKQLFFVVVSGKATTWANGHASNQAHDEAKSSADGGPN